MTATQKTILLNELDEGVTKPKYIQNGAMLKEKLPKTQNTTHDGCEDPGARIMSCRRRWGEGSQNTALFGAEELNELSGKLTFDILLCSKLRGGDLARPARS